MENPNLNQFHIPSFVTPCLPGIKHEYYGNYHMKYSSVSSGLVILTEEAFFSAIKSGDVSLVKKFFPKYKDLVNLVKTQSGLYPLHLAALKGHFDIVKYLIEEAGAIVDLIDNENDTPLLKASYGGYENIVQYLLKKNANVNYKDHEGWTALHNACSRGYCGIAQVLINASANVDCQNVTGQTPLMNACARGYLKVVQLLILTNSNPLLKNNIGETAYDRAAQNEKVDICIILEKYEDEYIKKNGLIKENYIHNSVLEILFENQRSSILPPVSFSSENLLKSDICGPWSTKYGTPCTKEEITLPKSISKNGGWFWMTDWTIDTHNPYSNQEDGWQYAKNFEEKPELWQKEPLTGLSTLTGCVRRRCWIRIRKRKYLALSTKESSNNIPTKMNNNEIASPNINNANSTNINYNNVTDTSSTNNTSNSINRNIDNDNGLAISTKKYLENARSIVQENIYSWDYIMKPTTSMDIIKAQFDRYTKGIEYLLKNNKEKIKIDSIEISNQIESYLKKAEILKERINNENRSNMNDNENSNVEKNEDDILDKNYSECSTPISEILNNQQKWEADSDAPNCNNCKVKFSLFNRRHHCRQCGLVFCAKCSNYQYTLRVGAMPSRLCKNCYIMVKGKGKENLTSNEITNNQFNENNNDNEVINSSDDLVNCPVCGKSLTLYGSNQNNIETHLKECLENENVENKVKLGNKYELQKLDKDLGKECPICFEDFLKGQVIVRIDCLCIFHKKCIDEWYKYSKVDGICPIHSIDN